MRMPAYDEVYTEVLKKVCQVALNRILDQLVFVAPMDTDRNQVGRLFAQLCHVVGNLFSVYIVDAHISLNLDAVGAIGVVKLAYS